MTGYAATAAARTLAGAIPKSTSSQGSRLGSTSPGSTLRSTAWPCLFFFVSGFPALLYQIVWQRALFTLYGVNIESVTMVVTAFMLGLGLGSVLGGTISRSQHLPLLRVFGLVELLIAAYGVFSLKILHRAADFTAGSTGAEILFLIEGAFIGSGKYPTTRMCRGVLICTERPQRPM